MKRLVVVFALLVVSSACSNGDVVGPNTDWPRPDGDWQLIDGVQTPAEFPITMSIVGTEVSGRAACNSYFGTVVVNGSAVGFGELGGTDMGCETAVMEAERTFLSALAIVESFEYRSERLVLQGASNELIFDPIAPVPTAELLDTIWVLESLIEGGAATSVTGDPATLLLGADGSLAASTGCRSLSGRWLEHGGAIVVPELTADGECPDALWKQDSLVVTVIGDEFRADIEGDILRLTSMGGDGLVYRADG